MKILTLFMLFAQTSLLAGLPGSFLNGGGDTMGVLTESAVLYIGHPEKENAMAYLRIQEGAEVKILDEESAYYKVVYKDLIGYVKTRAVKPRDSDDKEPVAAVTSSAPAAAPVPKPQVTAIKTPVSSSSSSYRITLETSLRESPDSKARVLARLQEGSRVEVLEHKDKFWWKVAYNGETGYAKAALLEKE